MTATAGVLAKAGDLCGACTRQSCLQLILVSWQVPVSNTEIDANHSSCPETSTTTCAVGEC